MLSISTAGKNRYLLHFNSFHSLTQWTAGIRLAMFEHATLQEAYTGSLIAGKGRLLNNISVIMEKTKVKTEDWTRVRFGAGTPWRRCWCVITPPDEKEIQKLQKSLKKKSAYERPSPLLKGDIKFYDTKKTKKARPIATIHDVYSAYAIYPQSKPLIDQSTLVKVEGTITIHSTPETTTEGFVFVLPEVHPAVTGFEMLLRWLVPLYDVFALYGRPNRLIPDTLDVRSLMFALPQERRYGYLEILDVATLIHESGSQSWSDKDWRARLKELTSARITRLQASGGRQRSRASSYRGHRNSLPSRTGTLRYEDGASIRSTPSLHHDNAPPLPTHRHGSASGENSYQTLAHSKSRHQRSASEALSLSTPGKQHSQRFPADNQANYASSRLSYEAGPSNVSCEPDPPLPPAHGVHNLHSQKHAPDLNGTPDRSSSESERRTRDPGEIEAQEIRRDLRPAPPPTPVVAPPAFAHEAGAKPQNRPHASPELRRANSRMSMNTLSQLVDAGQLSPGENHALATALDINDQDQSRTLSEGLREYGADEDEIRNLGKSEDQRGVIDDTGRRGTNADISASLEGMEVTNASHSASKNRHSPFPSSATSQYHEEYSSQYQQQLPQSQESRQKLNYYERDSLPFVPNLSHSFSAAIPAQSTTDGSSQLPIDSNRNTYFRDSTTLPQVSPEPQRPQAHRSSTYSITRKPLPGKSPLPSPDAPSPISRTSLDSLRERFVDADALDKIVREPGRSYTIDSNYDREADSIYDNESTSSPDYASTRRSTETKRSKPSMERPRAGVLKTVGTVDLNQTETVTGNTRYQYRVTKPQPDFDIPAIDFGPTRIYRPGTSGRPSTGGDVVQPTQERSNSRPSTGGDLVQPTHEKSNSRPSTSGNLAQSMHERSKSYGRLTPSPRTESPTGLHAVVNTYPSERLSDAYERPPSRSVITPEGGHRTPSGAIDSDHRRSVAWQPGATIGSGSPGNKQVITPEQFVQQRAAASRVTPVYAHGRKTSSPVTPPSISRNPSGEWPIQSHSRQVSLSRDMPTRPQSRGTQIVMSSSGDFTAQLSAREQELVARVTGSPLIHVATNANRQTQQSAGLIGTIEAREREKRDIKEGLSGQSVQHAIAQRQQHSHNHQNSTQSLPHPSPQLPMPGQYPPSPFVGTPQERYTWNAQQQQSHVLPHQSRQNWTSPAAQPYWSVTPTSATHQQPIRQGSQLGSPQQPLQQQATYQQSLAHQQLQQQQRQATYQAQGNINQGHQHQQFGPFYQGGK